MPSSFAPARGTLQGPRSLAAAVGHGSGVTRLIRFLTPNLAFPFILLGVLLEPLATLRVRGSIQFGDVSLAAAMVLVGFDAAAGRGRVWMPWWLGTATALYVLIFAMQTLSHAGGIDHGDLNYMMQIGFTTVLVPVVIASQRLLSARQLNLLVMTWLAGDLLGALLAALHWHGFQLSFLRSYWGPLGHREAGLTLHCNSLGFYSAMAVPLCLAYALSARRLLVFLWWMLCLALVLYVIDLSGSRAALATGIGSSAFVAFMFIRLRGRVGAAADVKMLLLVVVVGVGLVAYRGGAESALERLFGESETTVIADEERASHAEASLEAFWSQPLIGSGYRYANDAHNMWLAALQCGGVIGMLFLLLMQGGWTMVALESVSRALRRRSEVTTAIGLCGAFMVWLAVGLSGDTLLSRCPLTALGISALLLLWLRRPVEPAAPGAAIAIPGGRRTHFVPRQAGRLS